MCVFCKIIKGEIPSHKVYEDENFIGFLDINQVVEGKTLLVSKKHYETILDLPNELSEEMIKGIKEISKKLIKESKAEGFNLLINTYKVAGQTIPHMHVHILPRKKDDGLKGLYLEEIEN